MGLIVWYFLKGSNTTLSLKILVGIITLGFFFELGSSFFTDEINFSVKITKKERPILFSFIQYSLIVFLILLLLILLLAH